MFDILRRIRGRMGSKTGAVMMEYVILGTLIAAAALVAVIVFGKAIKGNMNAMATATTGQSINAAKIAKETQQDVEKGTKAADKYSQQYSDIPK